MSRIVAASCAAGLTLGLASSSAALDLTVETSTWGKAIGFHVGLAGRDLNGTSLNGEVLDGMQLEGVRYDAGELDGAPLADLSLQRGELRAVTAQGKHLGPHKVAGLQLTADLDGGGSVVLQVAASERHPDPRHEQLWGYEVWYDSLEGWQPLCGVDADGAPVMAIALEGRWIHQPGPDGGSYVGDPDRFTFACEGFVLAKCVTAGYAPWTKTLTCAAGQGCEHGDLRAHHQACTRALRADYFGDGTAHTSDGVLISMFDGHGVRLDSEDWTAEAEWDADGAVCVNRPRDLGFEAAVAPLFASDCGDASFFGDGTLLVTEVPTD